MKTLKKKKSWERNRLHGNRLVISVSTAHLLSSTWPPCCELVRADALVSDFARFFSSRCAIPGKESPSPGKKKTKSTTREYNARTQTYQVPDRWNAGEEEENDATNGHFLSGWRALLQKRKSLLVFSLLVLFLAVSSKYNRGIWWRCNFRPVWRPPKRKPIVSILLLLILSFCLLAVGIYDDVIFLRVLFVT